MEMIKFEDDVFNGNKYCFKCLAENCRFFTADTVATFKQIFYSDFRNKEKLITSKRKFIDVK